MITFNECMIHLDVQNQYKLYEIVTSLISNNKVIVVF
jgi:ABC-type cobalamin/Fe3+-siderophores transport system ATPase subunit